MSRVEQAPRGVLVGARFKMRGSVVVVDQLVFLHAIMSVHITPIKRKTSMQAFFINLTTLPESPGGMRILAPSVLFQVSPGTPPPYFNLPGPVEAGKKLPVQDFCFLHRSLLGTLSPESEKQIL